MPTALVNPSCPDGPPAPSSPRRIGFSAAEMRLDLRSHFRQRTEVLVERAGIETAGWAGHGERAGQGAAIVSQGHANRA